jgi:chromosome segregation ATPase
VLSEQLTALHHGFKDVHKQLLRRDLDDGDTYQMEVTTSTWENLVHELREELDETSLDLENALHQLDKAHSRNLRQEQLEEEIEFYRESARKAAEESSKALSMANEIRAQSVKDGENSLREMHRVQREWDKAQVEVAEFEKALAVEQKKGRLLDLERLNLSRQFAELGSDLLQKEIQLGESQRAWNIACLERDSMAESLRDAQTQIESLQGTIRKAETRASLSEGMCNEMKILLAEQDKLAQKENEAYEIQRRENEQMRARSELRRMREAHQVLTANLAAVEKRLNAANEELLVYRRLDIYTLSRAHATALATTHSPPRLTSTNESKRQEIFEKARTLLMRKKNELE